VREEDAPEVRGLDPGLTTVEEEEARPPLEFLDAARQSRLRQAERARRTPKAALLRERPRVPEQPEVDVHAAMLSKQLIDSI
jgi:hypothetical protein